MRKHALSLLLRVLLAAFIFFVVAGVIAVLSK